MSQQLPDIAIVTLDSLCQNYLGCYGADVETPTIDWLAASGIRSELCSPASTATTLSAASLFTGKYPFNLGIETFWGAAIPKDTPTLFTWLKSLGYQCRYYHSHPALATLNLDVEMIHLQERATDGFDKAAAGGDLVADAVKWLKETEGPKCLALHAMVTHAPYVPGVAKLGLQWVDETFFWQQVTESPEIAKACYVESIKWADQHVVKPIITEIFKGRPRIAIILGDHGESFKDLPHREHNNNATRHLHQFDLNVLSPPMLIGDSCLPTWRKILPRRRQIDLFPTLYGMVTGEEYDGDIDGLDMFIPDGRRDAYFCHVATAGKTVDKKAGIIGEGLIFRNYIFYKSEATTSLVQYDIDPQFRGNWVPCKGQLVAEAEEILRKLKPAKPVEPSVMEAPNQEVVNRLKQLGYIDASESNNLGR